MLNYKLLEAKKNFLTYINRKINHLQIKHKLFSQCGIIHFRILYKSDTNTKKIYRLDLATRSSSSFFLMAYEFEDPCKRNTVNHLLYENAPCTALCPKPLLRLSRSETHVSVARLLDLVLKRTPLAVVSPEGIRKDNKRPGFENKCLTLAALMSSSAKHSAIVLMFLNAASRAPVHSNQIAYKQRSHKINRGL